MPTTLSPEQPISPLHVRFFPFQSLRDKGIGIEFPEKNEALIDVMRSLNYTWSGYRWQRTITKLNGPYEDRLIQACHALLEAGFIVEVPDGVSLERVVDGEYAPEVTRWVMSANEQEFLVRWGRNEDLYHAFKRLPGSYYKAGRCLVRVESYKEVLDFAEQYGFSLSETAKKLVERQKEQLLSVVVVKPKSKKQQEEAPAAEHVQEGETYGIDPSLLDNDDDA